MTGQGAFVPRRKKIQDRFGLLLLLLIGSFIVLGFATNTWARVLAAVLQFAALGVAFLATELRREHRWLALAAAIGALAIVLKMPGGDAAHGSAELASIVLFLAILVAVLDRVLRHRRVTIQTLFGAVCAYFVIGLIFSSIYGLLDAFDSESVFGEAVAPSVYSYFSFTTLTTAGFGDFVAVSDLGRRVVAIEAVMGPVFLATMLARLVSLYKTAPGDDGGTREVA
jgi:Ion channel